MMPLTVAAAASTESNAHSIVATHGRVGREPDRDAGRDAHRALRARRSSRAGRSRAGRVRGRRGGRWSPSASTTSTASTCAEVTPSARQCGPPAFVADVAADRARLLRRRVGRVVQAEPGGDRARQVEVQHARLDPRDPAVRIDLEHAVHPGRDDDDRVVERGRAAREAGAAPTRDERPTVARARRGRPPRPRRPNRGSTRPPRVPARRPRPVRTTRARAARHSHVRVRPRPADRRGERRVDGSA